MANLFHKSSTIASKLGLLLICAQLWRPPFDFNIHPVELRLISKWRSFRLCPDIFLRSTIANLQPLVFLDLRDPRFVDLLKVLFVF